MIFVYHDDIWERTEVKCRTENLKFLAIFAEFDAQLCCPLQCANNVSFIRYLKDF